jgi:lysophospholipase L1-like esterase
VIVPFLFYHQQVSIELLLCHLLVRSVIPLTSTFVQGDGSLSADDYSGYGIHLVANGYRKWASALQLVIAKLLQTK